MLGALPDDAMVAGTSYLHLGECALLLNDETRIRRYHDALLPFQGEFHNGVVDRLLGELKLRMGDLASAAYLDSAERLSRKEKLLWDLAKTLALKATVADATKALALRTEAAALFTQMGNTEAAQRLQQGVKGRSISALAAGLSQREVDVLRLVAAGKSNHAIAEALFLSEKTIENHLTNIYRKTATDNRAAATAFAVRQGLA
jgi:DNA-binding CsgD family transcriptional regulator